MRDVSAAISAAAARRTSSEIAGPRASRPALPRIVVSGVRSSCEASATNRRWDSNESCSCSSIRLKLVLKLVESTATSSRLLRAGSRRPKSRARPISSAVTAASFNGLRARPATSHDAISAARSVGTPEMTRNPTIPDTFDCTTRVDCPVTTKPPLNGIAYRRTPPSVSKAPPDTSVAFARRVDAIGGGAPSTSPVE